MVEKVLEMINTMWVHLCKLKTNKKSTKCSGYKERHGLKNIDHIHNQWVGIASGKEKKRLELACSNGRGWGR